MAASETWYVIVNPAAGGGRGKRRWPAIEAELERQGIAFEAVHTESKMHAAELASRAAERGFRRFASVGGDGVANEVVNGLMEQTAAPTRELTLAVIPSGTGNDWLKTYGIPPDFRHCIRLMAAGHTRWQDLGRADWTDGAGQPRHRWFFNVAGMGYDAFVTKASNETTGFVSNKIFYFYLIIKGLWKYRCGKGRITLGSGKVIEEKIYNLTAGICRFNGGGVQLTPHAVPDDGLLAISLVPEVTPWYAIRHTPRFYDGSMLSHPLVFSTQDRSLRVEPMEETPILLEVDGEYLGAAPFSLGIVEKAVRVVVPEIKSR
jgi:diacylglycerol kinase (ATP)